jgi:hypothetical protein
LVPELTSLYLGGNQIADVPAGVRFLQNLKFLYLGGNQIRKLPKEICQLERLQALFLCFNQVIYSYLRKVVIIWTIFGVENVFCLRFFAHFVKLEV